MAATFAEAKEKLSKGITKEPTPTGSEQNVWNPPYAAAAGGTLPRVIDENERAIPGTTRYKVRSAGEQPAVYILAKKGDEASAKACYRETHGLKPDVEVFIRAMAD